MTVADVGARMILDSRGDPTVEVEVRLADGACGRASAPSGASRGSHEAVELRDGDAAQWAGLGVERALRGVRGLIAPALRGNDPTDQHELDRALVELDGTPDRSRLGANALVAVSVACARAGAATRAIPLWRHLADLYRAQPVLPLPMVNVLSGNLHAAGGMDVQDVLVVPLRAPDLLTGLRWVAAIYRRVRETLCARGLPALVGDEGGFGFVGGTSEAAIETVLEAIEAEGFRPGTDLSLAIDVAAAHLFDGNSYRLDGRRLSGEELSGSLDRWSQRYPICSIEDPFDEDAWQLWSAFTARTAVSGLQVLGDDLIVTDGARLERAVSAGAANAVLVKVNQVGTLTEAFDVVQRAAKSSFRTVVSARSAETEDDWLADVAVASGAGQIKVGSVARSERLVKYNRLLRIAESTPELSYAGGGGSLPRPTTA